MSDEMTDEELIGYCDLHCETPRALFSVEMVNRMLALAGREERIEGTGFVAVHEPMKQLVKEAQERRRR